MWGQDVPREDIEKSQITWLHLSDWHQGKEKYNKETPFNRDRVRRQLIKDIEARERIAPELEQVDFIIFSGDLAFSGQEEEYKKAKEELFNPVLQATGLSPERLFIVPGNHDLDRSTFKYLGGDLKRPFESETEVQEWLTHQKDRDHLLQPFQAFRKFVTRYTGQKHPDYATHCQWEINGKRIALLGINSALMAGRNRNNKGEVDDYGKLVIGEPQIQAFINEIETEENDIQIAVLHHPFKWLTQFDSSQVEQSLKKNFDFVLWGHQHESAVKLVQGTEGDCVIIPCGASYDRRQFANSYNFVHLDFETGQGSVYLRRWNDEQSEWIKDYNITDDDTDTNGLYRFDLGNKYNLPKKKEKFL